MKTKFAFSLLIAFLVIASLSCSLSREVPEQSAAPANTSTPSTNTPTREPEIATNLPVSTPTSPMGAVLQWTIKTGKPRFFGVATDGTVYAIREDQYVVISKNGEILQANEIDLSDCAGEIYGGFGWLGLNNRIIFQSDGIFHIVGRVYCIVAPGNPPVVEKTDYKNFFPYSDSSKSLIFPSAPDGFEVHRNAVYIDNKGKSNFVSYINKTERKFAYITRNGEIRVFDLPDDLDIENHIKEFSVLITPWDDIYCGYHTYDALGNNLGSKIFRFDRNGNFNFLSELPTPFFLGEGATTNAVNEMIFLPEAERVYYYSVPNRSLGVYDLNLSLLKEYQLPESFPTIDSRNRRIELFVGYDGAVYVYDTEFLDETTSTYVAVLSKYLLPDDVTK